MPDTMTIGFWLFWLGASAAYAGTMWLPSVAKSRKAALGVLALLAISGWTAMLAASSFTDYGRTWLDMPAAYFTGGLTVLTGVILILSRKREEQ